MRARLLDATVDCLVELGWARTTLPEIVARAGVARGAQVHHFPTKASLIDAVGAHLLDRYRDAYLAAFDALPHDERTIGTALDLLWDIMRGPAWIAAVELGLASRTDPSVAGSFAGFTDQVDATVLEVARTYFPDLANAPYGPGVIRAAVAMLMGLALQMSIDGDSEGRHAAVFKKVRKLLDLIPSDLFPTVATSQEVHQ